MPVVAMVDGILGRVSLVVACIGRGDFGGVRGCRNNNKVGFVPCLRILSIFLA